MAEPSNNRARFASTDEESMKAILTDRVPENAKRSTDQRLRTFKSYLQEKKISIDLATCTTEDLSDFFLLPTSK